MPEEAVKKDGYTLFRSLILFSIVILNKTFPSLRFEDREYVKCFEHLVKFLTKLNKNSSKFLDRIIAREDYQISYSSLCQLHV